MVASCIGMRGGATPEIIAEIYACHATRQRASRRNQGHISRIIVIEIRRRPPCERTLD